MAKAKCNSNINFKKKKKKIYSHFYSFFALCLSKALHEKGINSIQNFFSPFSVLSHHCQLFLPIRITYLLSIQVMPPHLGLWSFSPGWWRYLHHPGDGGGTSTTSGDDLMGDNFLLTTIQNETLSQYTLYNPGQFKLNKATGLPWSCSQTC